MCISSHAEVCCVPFLLCQLPFAVQKLFNLMESHLSIFVVVVTATVVIKEYSQFFKYNFKEANVYSYHERGCVVCGRE